ncbi:ABC transporter ATP-binding protein [Amycolatopsis balhimycina DSM 5908]|uniref:ABC transporter ATP-binding protein n=1 Tax=Amycolatopsis balhimycina DSM 5908 TaxID=1081091 RepID=A0A428WMY2_AMYBA|nr:ABC transporter ATP-binding protein [Amycolatopsis balhimycina]RSM44436.1 ABC transporter ATP-binding protein [Amycolatopsis balhimycina DSM 5908]
MPHADAPPVFHAEGLTKKYGRRGKPALDDVNLTIPSGRVIGLVGPNGAGKSTLLHLACGLIEPTAGSLTVLGSPPAANATHLARVGFVAQNTPVYGSFSVAEHLKFGAKMNPAWDPALAERRIRQVGLNPGQKAGQLSGGQRAQLALTIAAAKRPELLIFDEPAAALDPLARKGFLRNLMEFVVELGASAVLSSHLLDDIEQVCDYLIVLCESRVQVAGDVRDLLARHARLVGPREGLDRLAPGVEVIRTEHRGHYSHSIVRTGAAPGPLPYVAERVSLEELVLAYMTRAATGYGSGMGAEAATDVWEARR